MTTVPDIPHRAGGWWNMACWDGLSPEQQQRLILVGNLPLGYRPEGTCPNGAFVAIETETDVAPGPRFYCLGCAIRYLTDLRDSSSPRCEATYRDLTCDKPAGHEEIIHHDPGRDMPWGDLRRREAT